MGNPGASTIVTGSERPVLRLNKTDLPLMVEYDDKTYVLVLTKGEKLLLQKPQVPCGISWQGA
jgi:hypothetical protein